MRLPQEVGYIKAEIQSLGIRMELAPERKGGAGPAAGNTVLLDDAVATVPTTGRFVAASPYHVSTDSGRMILCKNGHKISKIGFVPKPAFYDGVTANGVPYWKIALLHGTNCLATTVVQRCIHWGNQRKRCRFCGIELSLGDRGTIEVKRPDVLAEVALFARQSGNIDHVTLTTGTWPEADKGIQRLASCALSIKKATGLPVHVQFEPPAEIELIRELKESLVDSVGIHIETFDMNVLHKIAPAKYELGLAKYVEAWEESVRLFGANQVSSFVIAGLGEKESSIYQGSEILAGLGVYPFIVPLRPIPGSLMADATPPSPRKMIRIYERISHILARNGLSSRKSKAGCVRCGACSALRDFETTRIGSS